MNKKFFGSAILGTMLFMYGYAQDKVENGTTNFDPGWLNKNEFNPGALDNYEHTGTLNGKKWGAYLPVLKMDSIKNSIKLNVLNMNSGGYIYIRGNTPTIIINTLNASWATFQTQNVDIYALDVSNASYKKNNNTLTITGDWKAEVSAGTTKNWITVSNLDTFNSEGSITLRTWGAYNNNFTVSDVKNLNLNSLALAVYTGGDTGSNTFDAKNVSEKVTIKNLTTTRGIIYTNTDFNVENFNIQTADFTATTDIIGNGNTNFKITNLEIFAGWGATTKATASFQSGKSLEITKAKISDWSNLDASSVDKVVIDTLESSYATIKAKDTLEIKNATFSNNETYLYAKDTNIGNITFNDGAKLYIKSGETLTAENLTMHNGSWLVAQDGKDSVMTKDTTIKQITFDNSRIYANNLTTDNITINNNAGIYLKDSNSTYTNNGDLTIADGSKLEIYNGNMINTGSLNFSLKPSNTTLIDVKNGYFQFNMDASEESKEFEITNTNDKGEVVTETVAMSIPKSKINIYTSTKDLITGYTYTLINASGGIQFLKDNKVYTSLDSDTQYGTIQQVFAQNIYFYDNQNGNQPLVVDFTSDTTNNTLSFSIRTTGVYVDITPYIKPGVWGFGGNAVFGIMNGAGGLHDSYTLKLEPKTSDEESTKGQEVIYYLKDYTYHNSGSTTAVFTVDATGSKFVLGKNRESAGEGGKIHIGDALSKSTMHIKADDIYLGGDITLGDGALISGHLVLETTKKESQTSFIGSNDNDHTSTINIRNHSSLKAIGDVFDYKGTINLTGNGTVSDEVTLNLSGITGKEKIDIDDKQYDIYIYKLVARDAKKTGDSDQSGGIYAKNFYIDTMEIKSSNNSYNEFVTDIGSSKINTLHFASGSSDADSATLKFHGGNLEVNTVQLDNYGRLDVSTLSDFKVLDSLSATNSIITFSDKSQEIDIKKIAKFENTTLTTAHFSSFGLNIAPNSSFYQSKDDENGFADIKLTGNYSIKSGFFNTGTKNITFNKINHLNIENLEAYTWGSYGGNLIFNEVKNIDINSLILSWNSSGDTTYPTFDSTSSKNANIVISNFNSTGGIFKTAKTGILQIDNISATKTTFETIGMNVNSIDWNDWQITNSDNSGNKITASYKDNGSNITISGLLKPNATLSFNGSSLDASKARFEIDSQTLDSTKITGSATFASLYLKNATANFNNLNLISGGELSYSGNSKITINGNFEVKGVVNFFLDGSALNPIKVNGTTNIYFDSQMDDSGNYQSIFNVYNLSGLKGLAIGTTYTLLSSQGGITYHYTNQSGEASSGNDLGYRANMLDRIGFFETQGSNRIDNDATFNYNGIIITKIADATSLGFKIDTQSSLNPYDKNRIEYWFYRKGGKEWIDAISSIGSDVMDAFQELMITKNNVIWANDVITPQNLDYFLKVGQAIQDAADQMGSIDRKSSTIDAVRLATDVNRSSRLVKLSSTIKSDNHFASIIKRLQNQSFAENDIQEDTQRSLSSIYQHGMRDEYKNNVWATAIGAANFVQGGNGTLYGINVGYDRFIENVIVGGYMAYAYSSYYGDLIQNNANNLNFGFYTRAFVGDNEFDATMSETIGWNQEFINSKEIITKQLNQKYDYNSYITNVNFNYGYLFYLQEKSMVFKPQVGLSYFYIANSSINGQTSEMFYQDLLAQVNADNKHVLALNFALETRKYLDENSYWYIVAGTSQDALVYTQGDESVRFVGNNILNYQKASAKNLRLLLTIGGEMEVYKRTFINFGLGSKLGLFYKDIGVSGNIGVRYIF